MPLYSLASHFGFTEQVNRYLSVIMADDIKKMTDKNNKFYRKGR